MSARCLRTPVQACRCDYGALRKSKGENAAFSLRFLGKIGNRLAILFQPCYNNHTK